MESITVEDEGSKVRRGCTSNKDGTNGDEMKFGSEIGIDGDEVEFEVFEICGISEGM